MTDTPAPASTQTVVVAPQRVRALELVPLVGLAVTAAGVIWGGGAMWRQVDVDSARIAKIEQRLDARDAKTAEQLERTTRIETKLDMLIQHWDPAR